MSILYKDFDKEVKDFFEKYFVAGTKGFKLENKRKAGDETVYVNPSYEDGALNVNFHYDIKKKNLKTKWGLTSNGNFVPKFTYECCGHKVELTDTFKLSDITNFSAELVHEFKSGIVAIHSKSKFGTSGKYSSDVNVAAPISSALALGASGSVNINEGSLSKLKGGVRYTHGSSIVSGSAEPTGAFSVSLLTTVKGCCAHNIDIAAQVAVAKAKEVKIGAQGTCPLTKGNVRLTASSAGQYGLAWFKSFPNNVTVSVGVDGNIFDRKLPTDKLGVLVVLE